MTHQLTYLKAPPTSADLLLREAAALEPPIERLEQLGPNALALAELLQIVLDCPSDPLVPLRLLAQWQTLSELAHTSPRDLRRVEGMTRGRVARLRAALELAQRKQKPTERARATSPDVVARLLMPEMAGLTQEQFRVVLLDTKCRVVSTHLIYQGNVNTTILRAAEVFAEAVRANVPSVIFAHSHPSGDISESPDDVETTKDLMRAGELLGITVLDHLIIGTHQFASLKERGLM